MKSVNGSHPAWWVAHNSDVEYQATGWITKTLGMLKDTAARNIKELVVYGLIVPNGQGRGRHYVLSMNKFKVRVR
jgi:predicted HTH transcriptional regulator